MAETLRWTFPLALLVVYGLLAAQLRSFAQPLLALASVPLALVGTVVGICCSAPAWACCSWCRRC